MWPLARSWLADPDRVEYLGTARAGVDQVGGVLADAQDDRTDEPVMLRDALGAPLTLPTEGEVGQPAVGDLWVVSADGQDRGVVMISAVRDLHVLAWPVTLPTSAAAAPAFLITVPDTGDFVAWPDAEFGLALAALDRRLAHVLDDRTTRTIRWAVTEDEPVDSVSTCPAVDTPEAVAAFEAVCSQAWALGDWAWPDNTIGEAALSQDALSDAGVEIAQLAQALGVKPGRASALARGVKVPTPEEVASCTRPAIIRWRAGR
jgi:hypothetical protein